MLFENVLLKVIVITETLAISEAPQKQGWWADRENHPYHRLRVDTYIEEFCGWKALEELIKYIPEEIQKYFFVTMFQTGARASEALSLTKEVFTVLPKLGAIKVSGMKLLKKYEKTGSFVNEKGEKHWTTEKNLTAVRKTFVIKRSEPFTPILEKYLEGIRQPKAYLFPSPQSHSRKFTKLHTIDDSLFDVNGDVPYSRVWAYQVIRNVNNNLPKDLKQKLGLLTPFRVTENGKVVKIASEIHLWLHWFRSQKASQLVADYDFDDMALINYFTWLNIETAQRYAKMGWRKQLQKMNDAQADYR